MLVALEARRLLCVGTSRHSNAPLDRSRSGCSGHGWTERRPVPIAFDPEQTLGMERSLSEEALSELVMAGGHQLSSVTIFCPLGRAKITRQFLEDLLRYDMRNALHVFL
jgi:hypothetical protein